MRPAGRGIIAGRPGVFGLVFDHLVEPVNDPAHSLSETFTVTHVVSFGEETARMRHAD
jgi:hypothetical protein